MSASSITKIGQDLADDGGELVPAPGAARGYQNVSVPGVRTKHEMMVWRVRVPADGGADRLWRQPGKPLLHIFIDRCEVALARDCRQCIGMTDLAAMVKRDLVGPGRLGKAINALGLMGRSRENRRMIECAAVIHGNDLAFDGQRQAEPQVIR